MSAGRHQIQGTHVVIILAAIVIGAVVIVVSSTSRNVVHAVLPVHDVDASPDHVVVVDNAWESRQRHVVSKRTNHIHEQEVSRETYEPRTWDWTEIFSFVPNGIRRCQNLFVNDKFLVQPFVDAYREFEREIKRLNKTIEGNSALRIEQYLTYLKLVEAPFINTVCETGFNAGHSALAWLEGNPKTRVYSFDLGIHDYAYTMASYLKKRYPGRLNVTWGDSTRTLPEFHRKNPNVKCDLIIIDGGHTKPICQSDYNVFIKMAMFDNMVVLDNYPDTRLKWMQDLGDVWERAKRRGELIETFACSFSPESPHGFSVGRFNLRP